MLIPNTYNSAEYSERCIENCYGPIFRPPRSPFDFYSRRTIKEKFYFTEASTREEVTRAIEKHNSWKSTKFSGTARRYFNSIVHLHQFIVVKSIEWNSIHTNEMLVMSDLFESTVSKFAFAFVHLTLCEFLYIVWSINFSIFVNIGNYINFDEYTILN